MDSSILYDIPNNLLYNQRTKKQKILFHQYLRLQLLDQNIHHPYYDGLLQTKCAIKLHQCQLRSVCLDLTYPTEYQIPVLLRPI